MGSRHSAPQNNQPPPPPPPKRYSVAIDNWKTYVENDTNNKISSNFVIGKSGGGTTDPAYGCRKEFISEYTCSPTSTVKNIKIDAEAWGKTALYTCSDELEKCKSARLELTDDGNLKMIHNGSVVWQSNTTKTGLNIDKHKASNGKYGRNYLLSGEFLKLGEFIGSPSGNCYLTVVNSSNDNVSLAIMYDVISCNKVNTTEDSFDFVGDNPSAYGLYSKPLVNSNSIGMVAYIDNDGNRHPYPDNMLKQGDTYFYLGNFDSPGNDIKSISNVNVDDCKILCNKENQCAGIVYRDSDKKCWLKNNNVFPNTPNRIQNNSLQLHLRSKGVDNNVSCSKEVIPISADIYDALPKISNMTPETLCQLGEATEKQQASVSQKEKELQTIIDVIKDEINTLLNQQDTLTTEMKNYIKKLENDVSQYEGVIKQTRHTKNVYTNVVAMNDDSNLNFISDNYHYLMWTILAIFVVIVGIRTSRQI
jgi:hypothetical protein